MYQRNNSYLLGLLVYFMGVTHLPIVSTSPVNVSTTGPTTIPGNETVYSSSTLTSSATENTVLFASISASNTTTQFVTAYTTDVPTVSQGNNSSMTGIFHTSGYVPTSAENATAHIVTAYTTKAPTTLQGKETVDISFTVASSITENTTLDIARSASNTTQFVTAYTTATPTTSLQRETLYVSSTTANSSERISTSAPNTALLTIADHTTSTASETATSFDAEKTSSVSKTPSTTSISINESPSETTTLLEASSISSTTGKMPTAEVTSATETTSTTGTASTTQCSTTTTKQPNNECEIVDADLLRQLQEELRKHEGYRDEIYKDSRNYSTFGIGHKITPDDPEYGKPLGTKISEERIKEAFEADVKAAIESCCKLFDDFQNLPKEVKLITLNMRFNLGHTGLWKFKKFREAVNNGDWDKAADEMVDSEWYTQVKDRAKELEERMRKVEKNCS